VSSGVPINDVQMVMGHEQASTTLNRYTHGSEDRDGRIRSALAAFLLPPPAPEDPEDDERPSEEGP
jgi:integrase